MFVFDLSTVLNFGKHKGKTIFWVLENDYTYIEWAIKTIDRISVSDGVKSELDKQKLKHRRQHVYNTSLRGYANAGYGVGGNYQRYDYDASDYTDY